MRLNPQQMSSDGDAGGGLLAVLTQLLRAIFAHPTEHAPATAPLALTSSRALFWALGHLTAISREASVAAAPKVGTEAVATARVGTQRLATVCSHPPTEANAQSHISA